MRRDSWQTTTPGTVQTAGRDAPSFWQEAPRRAPSQGRQVARPLPGPQTGVYTLLWKTTTRVTELKNSPELKSTAESFKSRLDEADKRVSDLKNW